MLKQAVLFFALLSLSAAYLAESFLEPIPEKFKGQQGCYIKEFDKVAPFGSTTPSKDTCIEYRCHQGTMTLAGCSVVVVEPPCYTVEDRSKPYPECCPKPKCGND